MIIDGTITKTYTPAQFEQDFPAVFKSVFSANVMFSCFDTHRASVFSRWHQAMMNRQTVKKIYAIREAFKA